MNHLLPVLVLSVLSALAVGEEDTTRELGDWLQAAETHLHQQSTLQGNLLERQDKVERGEGWEDPELRLSVGGDMQNDWIAGGEEETRYVSTVRLPLPHPWLRKAERADRLADLHLAEASVEEKVLKQKWDCLETGLHLQYLQADHQLLSEQQHLLAQAVEQTRTLIDQGVLTTPELTRLQLDALSTRQDLLRNRIFYYESRRSLSLLTGIPAQNLQVIPASIDPEALLQRLSDNPLPKPTLPPSLLARREKAKAQKASVQASRIPWFQHIQAQVGSVDRWGDAETAEIQVAISLPIFSFFDAGVRVANQTLDFLEVSGQENLRQQSELRQDADGELRELVPQLLASHREGLQLASQLEELKQQALPVKEKMKVMAMNLRLIDLQRKILQSQQSLELRLWSLYATEL